MPDIFPQLYQRNSYLANDVFSFFHLQNRKIHLKKLHVIYLQQTSILKTNSKSQSKLVDPHIHFKCFMRTIQTFIQKLNLTEKRITS